MQAYISVGATAQQHLTPQRIQGILEGIKPQLRSGNYGSAVEAAVVEIGLTLAGKEPSGGSKGGEKGGWRDKLLGLTPFGLFAGLFGFVQLNGWRENRRRRNVTGHLRRLQTDLQVRLRCSVSHW